MSPEPGFQERGVPTVDRLDQSVKTRNSGSTFNRIQHPFVHPFRIGGKEERANGTVKHSVFRGNGLQKRASSFSTIRRAMFSDEVAAGEGALPT